MSLPDDPGVRTLKGTLIHRWRGIVGKKMGDQLYAHMDYAELIVPPEVMRHAYHAVQEYFMEDRIRCFRYNLKTGEIRFDEAEDFDEAREPMAGTTLTVYPPGWRKRPKLGYVTSIWHHKWLWVMNDYDGFDLEESYEWSRLWTSRMPHKAYSRIGSREIWEEELRKVGLR